MAPQDNPDRLLDYQGLDAHDSLLQTFRYTMSMAYGNTSNVIDPDDPNADDYQLHYRLHYHDSDFANCTHQCLSFSRC